MRGEVSPAPARTPYAAERAVRTAAVDEWLAGLLGFADGVALVAVGGHGRGELAPASDLDLVLLHREETGPARTAEIADRVWYPIWDAGLRLDHAVRTVPEARDVARRDLRAALGLLDARHVAGDPALTASLREQVHADWRADAPRRLPGLREMAADRAARYGDVAYTAEPELKEARGGLRDVQAMRAVAAAWVADRPDPRVLAAYIRLFDARHALHETTGRAVDRLLLQEQDAVAHALGYADADALLRALAEAGRLISLAGDLTWRQVDRYVSPRRTRRPPGRRPVRRPLARDVVEQDGEAMLARGADPGRDPTLVLRAAAAAAQAGVPLALATVRTLAAAAPPLPTPWPGHARDALIALLGAGRSAIAVWEALDHAELLAWMLPEWERVRNRRERGPLHRFTVDRHLIETAAVAAEFTRDVSRPDLLLLAALLHDIGKGWPGDHSRTGEVIAREAGRRVGLSPADAEALGRAVRHHLLLPRVATRRDLDDPVTVESVASAIGSADLLELLFPLAVADGIATGPAAWNAWKAGLTADLTRRVAAVLAGESPPATVSLRPDPALLGCGPGPDVRIDGARITTVAPGRPDLLWQAAGVLALHRLSIRAASATSYRWTGPEGETVTAATFTAAPEYGGEPDPRSLADDLRAVLAGRLDVAGRLERRRSAVPSPGKAVRIPVPPPRVEVIDDASRSATVLEVRAHDRPGLLWVIGRALACAGVHIRAARVDTVGVEAVDAFYVVDDRGRPLADRARREAVREALREALREQEP